MWKFLDSEMKVIFGLTEDASRTDAEIADMYGLKKGTVASIRRRLLDSGAISYVNIPSFNKLGCELIGCHVGTTEPSERSDSKVNHYIEFCAKAPQIFQGLIGGTSVVLYTALRNATEFEEFAQNHMRFFTGPRKDSRAKLTSTVFPFTLSKMTLVPNFSAIVHRHFRLDLPHPKGSVPSSSEVETPDLSDTEKKILIAMVENPRHSDRQISSAVRLSRQAVTRIRNKLADDGMMTTVCVPRLYKWGFEICAVAHPRFSMEIPWEKRLRSQPRDSLDLSFLTLSKADESIANYLVAKYAEYMELLEGNLAWYHKVRAFDEPLEMTVFPLERSTELRTFEYGPALRNLLLG